MARPSQPRKRRKYVRALWSGGAWKWQPIITVDGRVRYGALKSSEAAAHAAALELREVEKAAARGLPQTLGEALGVVQAEAEKECLPVTIQGNYTYPIAQILVRYCGAETALCEMTSDMVAWIIDEALEDGLLPQTVSKYLRLINRAFHVAGLPSPVPQAKASRRRRMLTVSEPMPWYAPEEFADLLRRMRETKPKGHGVRTKQRDIDLVALLGHTGLRLHEVERCQVRDLNLDRLTLRVRLPKIRRLIRTTPIARHAVPHLERLIAGAAPDRPLGPAPRALKSSLSRWAARLGEEGRLHARALRHTFGTGLALTGASLPEIQEAMGHAPNSPVTVRYLHAAERHVRRAVDRLGDAYEEAARQHESGEPLEGPS